ncbi:hypothetical protein C8R44DRAFT_943038 [Mycena epipterygia]|nr:hypothetical protein C8R44DRAFT_943038 [Mycena epipterygia]
MSGIVIIRAMILSGIVVGIPVSAVYSTLLLPLQNQVFIGQVAPEWASFGGYTVLTEDAVIAMDLRLLGIRRGSIHGLNIEWEAIANVTITVSPQDQPSILHVAPGLGDINDILKFTDPIPVLPDSYLFAYLTWTSRKVFPRGPSSLLAPFTPLRTVLNMELNTLLPMNAQSPSTTLTLVQREPFHTKFIQDYTNTSVFNGAAALVSGRRRPLSALGIAHLFQRKRLLREWHEDFPALLVEGGRPGSETAGIVAFIRERLVDLGEDGKSAEHTETPGASRENAYKEIPPSDTDDELTADFPDMHKMSWKDVEQGSSSSSACKIETQEAEPSPASVGGFTKPESARPHWEFVSDD